MRNGIGERLKIKELIRGFSDLNVKGSKEVEITGIAANSQIIAPGNLFIAKKGGLRDGVDFIPQAIDAGAAAIVTPFYNPFVKQTQLIYPKPETIEAKLAARYYRNPSQDLWVAGITGTKGKTTTSYLIKHLVSSLGIPCGLIGTVETIVGEKRFASTLTTHDAIFNQKLLREMVDSGLKGAVLEVSSHGLAQGRVDEIDFDLALFTNLFSDHLDYHKSIEQYAFEKKKLFDRARTGVYHADSSWVHFMMENRTGKTFGIEKEADIQAKNIVFDDRGTSFTIENVKFSTPLIGRFNVSNLLGAIAVGLHLGADLPRISSVFSSIPPIPGRLESVSNNLGIKVFVDFAHTGDALENVLKTLREIALKRLIVVFGCGGGRDPGRRAGMGAAAEKWADIVFITSDNSREEDPEKICQEIFAVFQQPAKAILEIDRKKAIFRAIEIARKDDVVLIAGKGHERMQIFAHQTVPFDDCGIAKEALQIRKNSPIL